MNCENWILQEQLPNDSLRVDTLFQKAMDAGISIEVQLTIV